MGDVEYTVVWSTGAEFVRCALPQAALCSELKQRIADAEGPPISWQILTIGAQIIPSDAPLCTEDSPASPIIVVLTVSPAFPAENRESALKVSWKVVAGSDSMLEEICVGTDNICEQVIPSGQRIGCVGLDPDSGMLVVIGATCKGKGKGKLIDAATRMSVINDIINSKGKGKSKDLIFGKGKSKDLILGDDEGKGKGKGKPKDTFFCDDEENIVKGKGKPNFSDGEDKGNGKGKSKDKFLSDDEDNVKGKGKPNFSDGEEKGKGKDEGKSKGKGNGKQGKNASSAIDVRTANSVLVVPTGSGSDPFQVELGCSDHPVRTAVELHVVAWPVWSPTPSLGIAVALFIPDLTAFDTCDGPLSLCSLELSPRAPVQWTALCEESVDVEAVCLDRSVTPPRTISTERRPGQGRYIVFRRLRCNSTSNVLEEFTVDEAIIKRRITSIAWSPASAAVLLTVAGEHAIRVFQKSSQAAWQLTSTLGQPGSRGCQDGPASDLHFWFPSAHERVLSFPYSHAAKDSCPLVPGSDGASFVYSGGTLMQLSANLQSCRKVTSMREELWLTDEDEGTPEYPTVCSVSGICQGKVYRRLCRTDYTEMVFIRRLQISDSLRRPRSHIRRLAPSLYPSLTEDRYPDIDDHPDGLMARRGRLPKRCHEQDMDQWDGNSRWLGENFELPPA